jgi:hypothetical protein
MDQFAPQPDPGEISYQRFGLPKTGFADYWYPILRKTDLGRKPRAVRLAGRTSCCFAMKARSSRWKTAARIAA